MNHPKSPNSQLLQFMLRAQQLARQDIKTDKGYAMMMTSIITIMLFSLMGAFLTMTNIAKSSTDAYIDGNNTFFAAEAGLNKRAGELYQRFRNYNSPGDGATTADEKNETEASAILSNKRFRKPTAMSSCYRELPSRTSPELPSDLECRSYNFQYNNNIAKVASSDPNSIVLSEGDGTTVKNEEDGMTADRKSSVRYKAYTFVSDKTNYDTTVSPPAPISSTIPAGSTYAGLFAQEYIYTVSATAAKLNENLNNNTSQIGTSGDNKTVLQMDFKSRTIPLFQFGAFYEGDLELNPVKRMNFNGRLHTNSDMYLSAAKTQTFPLTIDGAVTAVQKIYTGNPALVTAYASSSENGIVNIRKTAGGNVQRLPSNATPKTQTEVTDLTVYNQRLKNQLGNKLVVPPVAFLTKVDSTKPKNIGEYYGKADLRLEIFPNRSVPFTLQSIVSGSTASNTCKAGVFIDKVSEDRSHYNDNTLNCTDLNEGQLRSLMQPVLVRPKSTQEYTTFCTLPPTPATATSEVRTPPKVSTTPVPGITNTNLEVNERILDALALTLAAQTTPVKYSDLTSPLSDLKFATARGQFEELLKKIFPAGDPNIGDIDRLKVASPVSIAALSSTKTNGNTTKGSCFRPAPIQALFNPNSFNTAANLTANTPTNFNDRRENRYIRMLQTNIESLTLWNRDNVFTTGIFDGNLTTPDTITANTLAAKFTIDPSTKAWSEATQSHTDEILFKRAAAVTTASVYNPATGNYQDTALTPGSFRTLGLAAIDRTEGGLVIHATIDQTDYPYPRKTGPTDTTKSQSPYGFAFNDGANLPAPLTIVTDQAAYSQGDWNNVDKQPASFLADTITVLSNSCLNTNTETDLTAKLPPSLVGQLNCGSLTGVPSSGSTTTVNAAFLAKTDKSVPSTDVAVNYYSGGLNNYMRILEDWGSSTMTYRGSFVSLGEPLEVSGRYQECNQRTAATKELNYACPASLRDWDYDTSFNSYEGLPPLPPRVIELTQDSFKRKFN
jgi:hypothetical protein